MPGNQKRFVLVVGAQQSERLIFVSVTEGSGLSVHLQRSFMFGGIADARASGFAV